MRRLVGSAFLAVVVSTLGPTITAASAITNGQLDRNRHPNVGVVGCTVSTPEFALVTTAQLISPTVVLTAGHATDFFTSPNSGCLSFFASFDQTFSFEPGVSTLLPAIKVETDPQFQPFLQTDDVGVFVLKRPVRGITPVQLPTAGLLDQLKRTGTLRDQQFVTVGYGAEATCSAGPCSYAFDATRKFVSESFNSLVRDSIVFQDNVTATGQGGTCFGDSGGPHFLGDSNLSVGVTNGGAPFMVPNACRAAEFVQRLDIPSVRAFLGRFVTLP